MLTKAQKKRKEIYIKKFVNASKLLGTIIAIILGFVFLQENNTNDLQAYSHSEVNGNSYEKNKKIDNTKVLVVDSYSEEKDINESDKYYLSKNIELSNDEMIDKKDTLFETEQIEKEEKSHNTVIADDGIININTASVSDLCRLKGIGEKRALDIIEYRNTIGNFQSIEEIMNVKGIKQGIFGKIKDNIKVED